MRTGGSTSTFYGFSVGVTVAVGVTATVGVAVMVGDAVGTMIEGVGVDVGSGVRVGVDVGRGEHWYWVVIQ